jgi:hypothetical protein
VQRRGLGLLTLVGAQVDSVIVPSLPADIVFDVAVRLVGLPVDFERDCDLEVTLTAPTWEELGKLNVPIQPRSPDWTHLPGSEINHHVMTRIDFEAIEYGAHHLEFVLDGKTQPHANTALTVVEPFAS